VKVDSGYRLCVVSRKNRVQLISMFKRLNVNEDNVESFQANRLRDRPVTRSGSKEISVAFYSPGTGLHLCRTTACLSFPDLSTGRTYYKIKIKQVKLSLGTLLRHGGLEV
jgi:hypothetical protein